MPVYNVSKGPFAYLDAQLTNNQAYVDAINKLGQGLEAAAAGKFGAGSPKVTHFKDDWLSAMSGAYRWGHLGPEDTLRIGLEQAIGKALSVGKPMEFFWVCANENAFHVYYCDGPRQITVIIFTPPPLDRPDGGPDNPGKPDRSKLASRNQLEVHEPIWVVKREDPNPNGFDATYPSPITSRWAVAGPPPGDVIERQIWSAP